MEEAKNGHFITIMQIINRPFFASSINATLSVNAYISANILYKCARHTSKFKLDITTFNKFDLFKIDFFSSLITMSQRFFCAIRYINYIFR